MQNAKSQCRPEQSLALRDLVTFCKWTIACHHSWPLNFIYTPKNACSTLKATLLGWHPDLRKDDRDWQQRFNSWHDLFQKQYCVGRIDVSKPYFCVSRNPYDRLLSAYNDKIGPGRDPASWLPFCKRYGFDPFSRPSLTEFLVALSKEPNAYTLDMHFRPQYYTNNAKFITPHFLGRVERIRELGEFLQLHGIKLINFRPHSSSLGLTKRDLTAQQIHLIRQIYAQDFDHYGYDPDPTSIYVPPSTSQNQMITREMMNVSEMRGRFSKLLNFANQLHSAGKYDAALDHVKLSVMLKPHHPAALSLAMRLIDLQVASSDP